MTRGEIYGELSRLFGELAKADGGAGSGADGVAAIASDADLAGTHGNPEIRKDPKDWPGPSMVGRRMSECPSNFLEQLAGLYDWKVRQDTKRGEDAKARFNALDAARARGWAKRNEGKSEAELGGTRRADDGFRSVFGSTAAADDGFGGGFGGDSDEEPPF